MKRTMLLILLPLFVLSGCAELEQDYIATNCNTDAAYANGMNAAKHGEDMDSNYSQYCPNSNLAELNKAYQKGYKFALSHTPPSTNTEINVINGTNAGDADKR